MQPHALHLRGVQVPDAPSLEDNRPFTSVTMALRSGNERAERPPICHLATGVEADLLGEHSGRGGRSSPGPAEVAGARTGSLTAGLGSTAGALPGGAGFDGYGFGGSAGRCSAAQEPSRVERGRGPSPAADTASG